MENLKDFTQVDDLSKGVKLLQFHAVWCGPCKMMEPVVTKFAKEHPDIEVVRVNVDEESEIASMFRVSSVPTLIKLVDGKVENVTIGYQHYDKLQAFMN